MKPMIGAVLFPIAGLLVWVIRLSLAISTGFEIRLKVEGYDPRDLLAGHYVQYRVAYDYDDICTQSPDPANVCICVAFSPENKAFIAHWAGSCSVKPEDTCSRYFIKGSCEGGRFIAGIERFYIPEAYSSVLMTIPPDSSISVALDGSGGAAVTGLFVGEQRVEDYAQEKLRTNPPQ